MLPVKKLPQVNAGRTQTKATARIGVKENSPVVKLLSERDERIAYGLVTVFHGMTSMAPQRAVPIRGHTAAFAI